MCGARGTIADQRHLPCASPVTPSLMPWPLPLSTPQGWVPNTRTQKSAHAKWTKRATKRDPHSCSEPCLPA